MKFWMSDELTRTLEGVTTYQKDGGRYNFTPPSQLRNAIGNSSRKNTVDLNGNIDGVLFEIKWI